MASTAQRSLGLAGVDEARSGDSVVINARCRFQTSEGHRVVSACGVVIAHYTVGDAMAEAHAMVGLVEQGWAHQNEIAAAFKVSERTVRRHQRRFEEGGLASLGRRSGYPRGRPRVGAKRSKLVNQWKAQGESNREIAQRLGVSEKAVRKQLRRLGWQPRQAEQLPLMGIESADPNLSGSSDESPGAPAKAAAQDHERAPERSPATADQTCPARRTSRSARQPRHRRRTTSARRNTRQRLRTQTCPLRRTSRLPFRSTRTPATANSIGYWPRSDYYTTPLRCFVQACASPTPACCWPSRH
jgi:DNA-binding CsgD family transcriptional regulator